MISTHENIGGKTARLKKSASQVPVPQTREQMEALVAQIAALKREEAALVNQRDKVVAKVNDDFGQLLAPLAEQYQPLVAAAETWATSHPAEFGKAKSIKFTQGTVGFRTGTPKLALLNRKWNWAKCLEAVQHYLPNFIRNKPEIDKEAILAQRADPGVAYGIEASGMKVDQDESFFVETPISTVEQRETVEAR